MSKVEHLRKQFKALDKAIDKALKANCDLAAEALAAEPQLCAELGSVSKKLREAYEEFDKITCKYL